MTNQATSQARVLKGVRTGGQFAPAEHSEPTIALAGSTVDSMDSDYRGSHRAPTDDGYSASIDRLTQVFPDDVYEHPEYVGSGEVDEETMAQLLKAKGQPGRHRPHLPGAASRPGPNQQGRLGDTLRGIRPPARHSG
ncbi:hypothetical protein RKD54_001943 [Pseudarthrobacter sp. SLBN-100]